jgi:hypothetical protein
MYNNDQGMYNTDYNNDQGMYNNDRGMYW